MLTSEELQPLDEEYLAELSDLPHLSSLDARLIRQARQANSLQAESTRLREENERLRQDADRLDWLIANGHCFVRSDADGPHWNVPSRAVIDAAISKGNP